MTAAIAMTAGFCDRAAADVVLADGLPQAPKVSAFGNVFAWSVFEPATGAWRLAVRSNGLTRILPIAARPTPFDVDLGSAGHGHLVASYSRCTGPSRPPEPPHGCRLFYYDITAGAAPEHPIAGANARGYSQFDPSMFAGRVAFARIADRRRVGAGNHAGLYVQRLAGGMPRRLPGGFANGDVGTGPTSLDLSATALAFAWNAHGATAFEPFSLASSQLSLDYLAPPRGGGGQILLALGTSGEISSYEELSPTLDAGTLYYGETGIEEGGSIAQVRSLTLPTAYARVAQLGTSGSFLGVRSTATGVAATIYSRCSSFAGASLPAQACEVALAEHLDYVDPDRQLAQVSRPTTISLSPQLSIEQSPGHIPGNWLAWSAYDAAHRDYRLMLRSPAGAETAAPVAPRAVPFDVELGPRGGGGLIAVYSRCRSEPRLDRRDMLALPATARGCRLYRYDIGSAGEHQIPGSGSRFLPSVWHDQLAFATRRADGTRAIYLGSLDGRARPRRLGAGPAGADPGLGPRALVLHEGRVAFVWEYRARSGLRSQLRLDERGGRTLLLDSLQSADGSLRELSPSLTRGVLVWASRRAGRSSRIEAYGFARRHLDSYLAPDPIEALATNHFAAVNHLGTGELIYARGGRSGVTIRRLIARLTSGFGPVTRLLPKLTG